MIDPEIEDYIHHYLQFRHGRERLQKNEDTAKRHLMTYLAEQGEVDDRGSSYFELEEPIDDVTGVKRERRVSQILDEDVAMELVTKYGLEESCLETVTVLNEDGLLAANFAGIIPDEEVKRLYSEKETFAFILMKE